jgi:Carboxypeptidase regulatory-like domain
MSILLSRAGCVFLLVSAVWAQQQSSLPMPSHHEFSIRGTVVNSLTNQPVSQAQVLISASGQNSSAQTVITGPDGRFQFHNVAPGKYLLMGEARGFFRQAFEGHWGYSTAIVVGPNLDSEHILFRLRPAAMISGTILDEAGDAVQNAQVMLFYTGVESGMQETTQLEQTSADDEGHYRFGHLPPGHYFVVVTATPWYAQSGVRGIMGPHVAAVGTDYSVVQGAYSVAPKADAAPQTGHSPLDVAYPTTYYAAATDSSNATAINLNPGDHFTADLTLSPVPAVHLRIKNPNPQMATNVQIFQRVFGQTMPLGVQSQTTEGYTEVVGVAPGQAVLQLEQFGNLRTEKPASRVLAVDLADDAEIDPARASAPITVSGHVTLEGATVLPPTVAINLRNLATGEEMGSPVSPKGDFQIQAPYIQPGRYVISTFNNGEAVVKSVSATGAEVSGRVLQLTGSGPAQLNIVLARGVGEIKGTAMHDSKPQAGVMIALVPVHSEDNPTLFRRDQSDSDGTFTLPAVVPGTYTLLAIDKGWELEWQSPAVLNSYLKNGQKVEVKPGGKYDLKINVQ